MIMINHLFFLLVFCLSCCTCWIFELNFYTFIMVYFILLTCNWSTGVACPAILGFILNGLVGNINQLSDLLLNHVQLI